MSTTVSTPVKERPILFSGAMVQGILRGDKTQTRRVIREVSWWHEGGYPQRPIMEWPLSGYHGIADGIARFKTQCEVDDTDRFTLPCPYGKPGDRLWVRETFAARRDIDPTTDLKRARHYLNYRADGSGFNPADENKWRPSIFMPRWASRLTLEVSEIRAEPLVDLSEADARAEGCGSIAEFQALWDSLNASRGYGWDRRPWVWVVSFRRIDQ